jgi:ParB-like chromosome segregation protein Spo0J
MGETVPQDERRVALEALGERMASLRLRTAEAVRAVQQSLVRHGQLTATTGYLSGDGRIELVDGFKRLQASRALGWPELRVHVLGLDGVQAKAALEALNQQGGLTELEEGWVVRALYREDKLTQPQIGQLLARHKSWVCRRLMLVEQLDEVVQGDVRLGLLAARTAVLLARLPRGNQEEVAQLVARRGLTTKQTEQLVTALLAAADEAERRSILDDWREGRVGPRGAGKARPPRSASTPAQQITNDIGLLCRVSGRLEARLLEQPLSCLGAEGAALVRARLTTELRPALSQLLEAIDRTVGGDVQKEAR